jgi:endoglucanase Acf2
VTTQLKTAGGDLLNHTLQALYLHQQNHLASPSLRALTTYSYTTLMGEMRVLDGNAFTTTLTHHGVLPILPQVATSPNYTATLNQLLDQSISAESAPDSYFSGKEMARLAQLALIADQIGDAPNGTSTSTWRAPRWKIGSPTAARLTRSSSTATPPGAA